MITLKKESEEMTLQEAIERARKFGLKVNDNGILLCPFHPDRNPSGNIYFNKTHGQVEYHCFGCGVSMGIDTFFKKISEKVTEYQEQGKGTVDVKEISKAKYDYGFMAKRLNENFFAILQGAGELEEQEIAYKALEYLQSRGFDERDIETFQIGFCLREHLEGVLTEAWARDELRKAFLVFPIKNREGRVVSFQFEDFLNRGKLENTKLNLSGKRSLAYLSDYSPETPIFVCEAIYDALSLEKLRGTYTFSTVALLGQASQEQIQELKELAKTNTIILALDNDKAGREGKEKLIKELVLANPYIYGIRLPDDVKDLNECLQRKGLDGIEEVILGIKKETLFGNLQEQIPLIIERFKEAKRQAIPIPKKIAYLSDFLKDGILPGLYGVAGMPGIGKTTWLNILCDELAKGGYKSFYFLTEEPNYRLITRTLKREGKSEMEELAKEDWIRNRFVVELTSEWRAETLKELIPSLLDVEGRGIIIVDSLHALGVSNDKLDLREKTILKTEILSHIARDYLVPVFFTSFIPKSEYRDTNKEPNIGVFKEAGEIEFLIDVGIVFWITPENLRNEKKEIKLIFVKNRFGKTGEIKLEFDTQRVDIRES